MILFPFSTMNINCLQKWPGITCSLWFSYFKLTQTLFPRWLEGLSNLVAYSVKWSKLLIPSTTPYEALHVTSHVAQSSKMSHSSSVPCPRASKFLGDLFGTAPRRDIFLPAVTGGVPNKDWDLAVLFEDVVQLPEIWLAAASVQDTEGIWTIVSWLSSQKWLIRCAFSMSWPTWGQM